MNVLVVEPSVIIRRGLLSVLSELDTQGMDLTELSDLASIKEHIAHYMPDVVIVNPLHLGLMRPADLRSAKSHTKFIALQNYVLSTAQINDFDALISIGDTPEQITEALMKVSQSAANIKEDELSAREKEIVAAIAMGQSNKEIADTLCISTHTVMTHRKNIASKLRIHNSAGLTIYAIVNKLIDISDVQ